MVDLLCRYYATAKSDFGHVFAAPLTQLVSFNLPFIHRGLILKLSFEILCLCDVLDDNTVTYGPPKYWKPAAFDIVLSKINSVETEMRKEK